MSFSDISLEDPTMAATATTGLSSASAPAARWQDLPDELQELVVSQSIITRASLENLITANCPATGEARRLYWSTATPENNLLSILESKPSRNRQSFANLLRGITIRFKAPGDHHEGRDLQYPRLQRVTVVHDQVLMGVESYTYARIKRFIGPRLRNVEIGCQLHEGMNVKPTTDDFLPLLAGCSDLCSLTLRARVKHATPVDLVDVLNNCTTLSFLKLEKYTEPLIDESTIAAIAAHPAIRFLQIDKHLDTHLLLLVSTISQPFSNISHLARDSSAILQGLAGAELDPGLEITSTSLHTSVIQRQQALAYSRWRWDTFTFDVLCICHYRYLILFNSCDW